MQLLRFIGFDLKQSLFNGAALFNLIIIPCGMYLIFGAMQDYSNISFKDGNAAAYVMIGMSIYGAVMGAMSAAGNSAAEIEAGWGRQLALSPLTPGQLSISQVSKALVTTAFPVVAVNIIALFTGVEIPADQQAICALVAIFTGIIFSFYAVAVARIFKNARAVAIASGIMLFFSFFGTTFNPLSLDLLKFARFTPMYGVTELSRFAFTGGDTLTTDSIQWFVTEPLWYALVNFIVWGGIFIGLSFALQNREKTR